MVNFTIRIIVGAIFATTLLSPATARAQTISRSSQTISTLHTEPRKLPVSPFPPNLGVKRILLIILENGNPHTAENDVGMKCLHFLAKDGTELRRYYAVAHPSQPNYIALISGRIDDVKHGDDMVVLNRPHLDQALGNRWKVYAEDYPAFSDACNLSQPLDPWGYARRHIPFLNFCDVVTSDCHAIVKETEKLSALKTDIAGHSLPDFALLIPNLHHDGHKPSDMGDADEWLWKNLKPLLINNAAFTKDLLVILTFDEDHHVDDSHPNRVFTVLWGDHVVHSREADNDVYDHYDLLATIEAILHVNSPPLPPGARPIGGIWR